MEREWTGSRYCQGWASLGEAWQEEGPQERTKPQTLLAVLVDRLCTFLWKEGMQLTGKDQTETQHVDGPEFLKGLRDKRYLILD